MTADFMFSDLWRSLLAVLLFPLFVLLPGYALAWLCDLCAFRRRTQAFRLCLAVCLSMAVCPIAIYLLERFASRTVMCAVFAALWVIAASRLFTGAPAMREPARRAIAVCVAVWAVIALFSLIDLQFGGRDYYSITALDSGIRTGFTHSIAATGIPPWNPFYFPGHGVLLRYHYFWMILCGMVERAGFGVIGARQAWIASVVWCGIGFMAVIALAFRTVFYRGPETFRRRALTGIVLAGATGLDILPAITGWIMHFQGMERAVQASIDWWNLGSQVCGFVSSALWEAHYLSGLVACITAFLLLWEGAREPRWRARISHALVAGVALASALGMSIYVSFVFAAFLAAWITVAIVRKWWREVALYAIAGAAALLCAAPYLAGLRGPAGPATGSPLEFQVRTFSVVTAFFESAGIHGGWRVALANLAALPINYFLEFGFFFAAGRLWWVRRKRPLDRSELAVSVMLAVSLLICTFVRSSVISNNDLGWRGMLVAQFAVLLWSVDVVTGAKGVLQPDSRRLLGLLLFLGFAGSAYDIACLRFYPALADRGTVATMGWMTRDHRLGPRNFAEREAYEWVNRNTPSDTTIQFNPHVVIQDTAALVYAERQMVSAADNCMTTFGGDPSVCPGIQSALDGLYTARGQPAPESIGPACHALPVDIFIANDTDAVWRDPRSWVWKERPVFANSYVRLFACGRHQP